MKKITYKIAIVKDKKKDVKEIKGYLYEVDGVKYGIDHRKNYGWIISELSTGRKVESTARLKDIYDVLTPEFNANIKRALENLSETLIVNHID